MASEIRVDKINSLSGVGTVTLSPTGVDISGITTVSTLKVGTGLTASSDGDIFFTGIATATTFSGSGASLTALPAGQLTGTVADARISTLTASKLSGALPAISALNLTNVPAANVVGVHTSLNITGSTTTGTAVVGGGVTISESGIEASGIGITCANLNGGQFGRRNKIINGAMEVAQRGTSSTSTGILTLDRMYLVVSNMDQLAYAQKQTADGPDGFSKCFEFDVTTAESALDADDLVYLRYIVEAQDLTPLFNANGTGKDFVLSFYVKAYQAGTYQVSIYKPDNTIRFLVKTYTVDASATWQRVVIPFTGDTGTSGMNSDTGQGFLIDWKLVAGTTYTSGSSQTTWGSFSNAKFAAGQAVDVSTSTNNYWRITGIQLEVGSEATAFEHRSFGEELSLCQRYFCKSYRQGADPGAASSAADIVSKRNEDYSNARTDHDINYSYPMPMRATPTLTFYSYDGTSGKFTESEWNFSSGSNKNAQGAVKHGRRNISSIQFGDSLSAGKFAYFHFTANAEL